MSEEYTSSNQSIHDHPIPRPFRGAAISLVEALDKQTTDLSSLYHYTSSTGLLGIIEQNCLRFSNALFLNDGSEMAYGSELAAQAIDMIMDDKPDDEKLAAEDLKNAIRVAMFRNPPVVFCMSEENNLLNQWRDYGNDVTPYAIELDRAALEARDTYS